MKKIVALVLAMVMVLGLATTAFAAKMGADLTAAQGTKYWDYTIEMDDAADEKDQTFATYEIEAVATKDGADMWWTATNTDVAAEEDDFDLGTFVLTDDKSATYVLIDGKTTTYYKSLGDAKEIEWDAKAVKVVLPGQPADAGDWKCNTYYNNNVMALTAPGTFYYDAAEEVFYKSVKGGSVTLNVNGVAIFAEVAKEGVDYVNNGHDVIVNYAYRADKSQYPTKAYCELCKTEFKFVYGYEADALAAFGLYGYFATDDVNKVGFGTYIEAYYPAVPGVTATAPSAPAAGETVESAKTFDAGIAMYVGMSVMAAAGSAVVLKKKD